MIEPSSTEQAEWPEATEHYVHDLDAEIKRLRGVVQEVRDDAIRMPEELRGWLGDIPERRKAWGEAHDAETDRLCNGGQDATD